MYQHKYHVIRLTKRITRGRWGIAREIDRWGDGVLDLALVEGEDYFYSPSSAREGIRDLLARRAADEGTE